MLDLGCASGYPGKLLSERGCQVWGLDIDPSALDEVPRGKYRTVAQVDLNAFGEWPFAEERFDVVLSARVLKYLVAPEQLLQRLPEVWCSAGRIIGTRPFRLPGDRYPRPESLAAEHVTECMAPWWGCRVTPRTGGWRIVWASVARECPWQSGRVDARPCGHRCRLGRYTSGVTA